LKEHGADLSPYIRTIVVFTVSLTLLNGDTLYQLIYSIEETAVYSASPIDFLATYFLNAYNFACTALKQIIYHVIFFISFFGTHVNLCYFLHIFFWYTCKLMLFPSYLFFGTHVNLCYFLHIFFWYTCKRMLFSSYLILVHR